MGTAGAGILLLLAGALSGRLTFASIVQDQRSPPPEDGEVGAGHPRRPTSRRTRLMLAGTIALGAIGLGLVLLGGGG